MSYHVIGRRGLGEYCNDLGCFNYDRDRGAYVNGDGKTEDELRAPVHQAIGAQYVPGSQGGANSFLISNPTGTDFLGGTQQFNPNFYATREAAQQFAAALGGTVVNDPTAASFNQNQPMYAIQLPNGTTVNAGALGQILNNPTDNENVRSGEIAKLIGAAYQPGIAESLRGGSRVNLSSAPAQAPGYNVQAWGGGALKPAASAKTPAGQTVTSSNSAAAILAASPDTFTANPVMRAFDLNGEGFSIPKWAWFAAAGVALFMFSGRSH